MMAIRAILYSQLRKLQRKIISKQQQVYLEMISLLLIHPKEAPFLLIRKKDQKLKHKKFKEPLILLPMIKDLQMNIAQDKLDHLQSVKHLEAQAWAIVFLVVMMITKWKGAKIRPVSLYSRLVKWKKKFGTKKPRWVGRSLKIRNLHFNEHKVVKKK